MKLSSIFLLLTLSFRAQAWIPSTPSVAKERLLTGRKYFFKALLDKAFENDDNLANPADKRTGQIDEGYEEDTQRGASRLTATQEMWRKKASQAADLAGKSFDFDFYLTGVPNKDPSNDLFGAKVNVSSRDRKVGQTIPDEPTVGGIRVTFLDGGKCMCETDTAFTDGSAEGDWKLSDDGRRVRFRVQVTGFTRTIETKGSIQAVFWSDQPDRLSRASTVYSIPAGWLYGEADVSSTRPGSVTWKDGLLKIEQSMGVLGAGTKMTPCGKFIAKSVGSPVASE